MTSESIKALVRIIDLRASESDLFNELLLSSVPDLAKAARKYEVDIDDEISGQTILAIRNHRPRHNNVRCSLAKMTE